MPLLPLLLRQILVVLGSLVVLERVRNISFRSKLLDLLGTFLENFEEKLERRRGDTGSESGPELWVGKMKGLASRPWSLSGANRISFVNSCPRVSSLTFWMSSWASAESKDIAEIIRFVMVERRQRCEDWTYDPTGRPPVLALPKQGLTRSTPAF